MISRFKRVNSQFEFGSTLDRLKIYQKLGLDSVDTVVDIGVSDGRFLMASKELFPHVKRKIGIDPIDEYKKVVEFEYVQAVVGSSCKEVQFSVAEDLFTSSMLYPGHKAIVVKQFRMDCLFNELGLQQAEKIFVKVDTQGTDLECLKSFGEYNSRIVMAIVEIQMRPYAPGMRYFTESVRELSEMGYEVCEFLSPIYRNHDGTLGQIDLLLVPKNSPVLQSIVW